MIILILLTSILPLTIVMFALLCDAVIVIARSGYSDESVKPAPGSRWPRLTLRSIIAILRGPERLGGTDRSVAEGHEPRRRQW